MRDWFAAFASETRATRATRATNTPAPQKSAVLEGDAAVAHADSTRATRATGPSDPTSVAHVAQARGGWATNQATPEMAEYRRPGPSVAHVAHVAREFECDWLELYAERAAFRQYEAGYRRDVAQRLAFGEVVEAWCRRHPQPHDPAVCAGCGRPLAVDVLDLPDGSRVHWERHREFACLIAAGLRRKERAVAALAALGLTPPGGWEPT